MSDYLAVLDQIRCPTCGLTLACDRRSAAHCGEAESHVARRSQASALRLLREMFPGGDLDATLRARGSLPRPVGRPAKVGGSVAWTGRLTAETVARIKREATQRGVSQADVVDEAMRQLQ